MAKGKPKKATFNSEPLVGEQKVSQDGGWIQVGSRKFKRTVLPSTAVPSKEEQEMNSVLEELDQQAFKEEEAS